MSYVLYSKDLHELLGELFIACEMPEPPKQSFFKGLFSGGVSQLDREELCKYNLVLTHVSEICVYLLFIKHDGNTFTLATQ